VVLSVEKLVGIESMGMYVHECEMYVYVVVSFSKSGEKKQKESRHRQTIRPIFLGVRLCVFFILFLLIIFSYYIYFVHGVYCSPLCLFSLLFFIFDILLFPLRSTEKSKSGQKKKKKKNVVVL